MTTIGAGIQELSIVAAQHLPAALHHAQLEQLQARQNPPDQQTPENLNGPPRRGRAIGAPEAIDAEADNNQSRGPRTDRQSRPVEPLFGRRAEDQQQATGPRQSRRSTDFRAETDNANAPPGATSRPGLPAAGFLAQFIAQEVAPEPAAANSPPGSPRFTEAAGRYRQASGRTAPDATLAKQLDRV